MLFDLPVEILFEGQKWWNFDVVIERIQLLIELLKPASLDRKIAKRIAFLNSALSRLTRKPENE
jgi:hypothetical protein